MVNKKDNNLVIGIIVMVAIILFLGMFGFGGYGMMNGYGMMGGLYGGYGSGMMFFGWMIYSLIIVFIIAAIYWLIKTSNR